MLRLWRWYQNCLTVHPVKTQMISSGLLWGVGDIAAQTITFSMTKNPSKFLYEGLDRFLKVRMRMQQNSVRFVATKVALDGVIFGPLDLLVFFTYMGFSNGKSVPQIKEDVKRDFIPALALEGGIWPILQVANFRYVPVRYQLLYVNIFCLIDSCFLSWIEQQEDAAWKHWFKQFFHLEGQKDKGE